LKSKKYEEFREEVEKEDLEKKKKQVNNIEAV
jgi:hypothetical protein